MARLTEASRARGSLFDLGALSEPSYARGVSRGRKIGIALAVGAALLLGGWAGGKALVSSEVNAALADRGMQCDPIDVVPSADLSRVEIGPTRCTFERGRIRWLRAPAGATVYLDGQRRARRVTARGLELDLREEPPREMISALVTGGPVPPRLRRGVQGLAALSAREDLPRIEIDRILVQRDTHSITFRDVVLDRDGDALAFRVAQAAPPPIGRRRLRIAGRMVELAARATEAEVHLSGRIELEATIGRRDLAETVPFRLDATGLDAEEPDYRASVQLSERLREVRERAERRRAAQGQAADEPAEDPAEGIHALSERLRDRVERARERVRERPAAGRP